jgi:Protein of unknown function (DUF3300)
MEGKFMKIKTALLAIAISGICFAQAPPPAFAPPELDRLVQRIALYPDPLLAQVLSASTFADEIPDAAKWADQHHYLAGPALANAITEDQLPWDPSVQALLPFPSVLQTMAADTGWTQQLGNAVLSQRQDVMDAVQRERAVAMNYGYLRSGPRVVIARTGPYITIMPVDPAFMYVPYYDPGVVFIAPRPGFAIGGAINFGFGFNIGVAFQPWGWGGVRLDWASHGWFIHGALWGRNWANRAVYVHNYPALKRFDRPGVRPVAVAPHPEGHKLEERSPKEREADRTGARRQEEHR